MRNGKTKRDKEGNNPHDRCISNRAERTAWMHGEIDEFPKHTCNGKKNRKGR